MLNKLRFYGTHSLNDLWVNKRLTFFALLSIAAGVAAIVSLQTLGVMINDTLTGNLQEINRGDLQLEPRGNSELTQELESRFFGQDTSETRFSLEGIERLQAWLDNRFPGQVDLTYRLNPSSFIGIFTGTGTASSMTDVASGEQIGSLSALIVDTDTYPFYGEIRTTDNQLLSEAVQSPTDIVVVDRVAQDLDVEVGDTVQVNGSDAIFTIQGIVTPEQEIKGFSQDIFLGIFGFYYLDLEAVSLFEEQTILSDFVFLRLQDPAQVAEIHDALSESFPGIGVTTTEDIRELNEQISEQINQLVTVMGLVSLLIGSIGIINTMQVIVRRRILEVAVLKTIGLQAEQVTILFLVEAFILGVIGSVFGVVLGWVLTFLLQGIAGSALGQELTFRIAATPAINGFVVGVVVATVFGFLPTLSAGQIRPGVVLRPNDTIVPRVGRLRSLLAIVVIIIVLTLIAQTILGSFTTALAVVTGAFIVAGLLYLVLYLLIWVIGRLFPSLGVVDLKIALRQMSAGRGRGASTLLALVIGVFSLSTITLLADSVSNLLDSAISQSEGNIIVSVATTNSLSAVEELLVQQRGVNSYNTSFLYNVEFQSLEKGGSGETFSRNDLLQLLDEEFIFPFPVSPDDRDEIIESSFDSIFSAVNGIDIPEDDPTVNVVAGRTFTEADTSQPYIVFTRDDTFDSLGIEVGDKLTYIFEGGGFLSGGDTVTQTFEVLGIVEPSTALNLNPSSSEVLISTIADDVNPSTITISVDIDEAFVPEFRRNLTAIPGVFALDSAVINRLITSLLGTFTAFPTLVATLGLVVGGVVIANSVALSTMERRREIAVMKSIGLQRERVLGMLLLENGILGLIGGLIGVGTGLVALIAMSAFSGGASDIIPYGTALILMLLCVIVALIAAMTSAWGASGEKPLNVLRYE